MCPSSLGQFMLFVIKVFVTILKLWFMALCSECSTFVFMIDVEQNGCIFKNVSFPLNFLVHSFVVHAASRLLHVVTISAMWRD